LKAQTYSEWIEFSFQYLNENRLDSAEIALKNALKTDPANALNPFLFNNLGTIQRRQGKASEALESYTLALKRYPKNTTFLSARASLFSEIGSFNNALIDYSILLDEDPNNEEALYQRGLLYTNLKEFDSAKKDFNQILELNPLSFFARIGLASLLKIEGNWSEAEKIYNYLEEQKPELPDIYAGRAELFLLMEKGGKALADINKAIRLSGEQTNNPYLYIIRSKAKILLYEKQSAIDDIHKALSLGYDKTAAENLLELIK
jgi:tetratricopeptide (TPR) repeat protein